MIQLKSYFKILLLCTSVLHSNNSYSYDICLKIALQAGYQRCMKNASDALNACLSPYHNVIDYVYDQCRDTHDFNGDGGVWDSELAACLADNPGLADMYNDASTGESNCYAKGDEAAARCRQKFPSCSNDPFFFPAPAPEHETP